MAPLNGVLGAVLSGKGVRPSASWRAATRAPIGLGMVRRSEARPVRPRLRVISPTARMVRIWRRTNLPGLVTEPVTTRDRVCAALGMRSGAGRAAPDGAADPAGS